MIEINVTKILAGLGLIALFFFGMFQALITIVFLDALSNSSALPLVGFVGSFIYLVLITAWGWEKVATR